MEQKISNFVKWFAIFLALWFGVVTADEILPSHSGEGFVVNKNFVILQEGNRAKYEYFVTLNDEKKLKVSSYVYDSVLLMDKVSFELTPVYSQIKSHKVTLSRNEVTLYYGPEGNFREVQLLSSSIVVLLSLCSAFLVNRFELRVTLFFFAFIVGAMRWWILGMD